MGDYDMSMGGPLLFLLGLVAVLIVWLAAGFTAAAWTAGGLVAVSVVFAWGKAHG